MTTQNNKNPKFEINQIIESSDLKSEQKEMWSDFVGYIDEKDAVAVLETLQEDPNALEFLTQNLEEKTKAMKTGDENLWKNIVDKEKDYIESK